ncbi:hypothetical protein ACWCQZ_49250, partial [Streptomyces sp. NPDC002285]
NQVLQIIRTAPSRVWHARDLAAALGITTPYDIFCVQLGRWTREGLLNKVANATYTLATDLVPGHGRLLVRAFTGGNGECDGTLRIMKGFRYS